MIAFTSNVSVERLLSGHPRLGAVTREGAFSGLTVRSETRTREIQVGLRPVEPFGLLELMDNNPLVCADSICIPSLAASLFLVALGPLLSSGLVQERPAFISNVELDEAELELACQSVGWHLGVNLSQESGFEAGLGAATGLAVIETIPDAGELIQLYDQWFGRSVTLRGWDGSEPPTRDLKGKPMCLYHISVQPDQPFSLVAVRVLCDATGSFEAAQIVSTMNVMFGFEDALGLSGPRS